MLVLKTVKHSYSLFTAESYLDALAVIVMSTLHVCSLGIVVEFEGHMKLFSATFCDK